MSSDDGDKSKGKAKGKGRLASMIIASKKISAAKKKTTSIFDNPDWLDEEFNDG